MTNSPWDNPAGFYTNTPFLKPIDLGSATNRGGTLYMTTVDAVNVYATNIIGTNQVLLNDDYLESENAAGSGTLGLIKADATDNTVVNAATGKTIKLSFNSTANVTWALGTTTFATAAHKLIAGATSIAFWNNANTFANLTIADAGLVTVNRGNLAVTAGNLVFAAASAKVIPGATSLLFRDTADAANNLIITDAGVVTARAGLVATAGGVTATAGDVTITNGNLKFTNAATFLFAHTTTNACTLNIAGGVAATSGNSAFVSIKGCATGDGNDGALTLTAGNNANANLFLNTTNASSTMQFAGAATNLTISHAGKFSFLATNTAGGTTGNQTINKPSGTVNIAAGGSTITVTNSLCTTSSLVIPFVRTNDATALVKNAVPGSGSFVITMNAAVTAETSIGFLIIN